MTKKCFAISGSKSASTPEGGLPAFEEISAPLALANSLAACVLSSRLNPSERQWAAYQLVRTISYARAGVEVKNNWKNFNSVSRKKGKR